MRLSDFDQARVRYHLGYSLVTSIPAGDYSRFIEAVNNIPDSYFYSKLIQQIRRCDTAERKTEVASTPSTRLEKIEGDVDRTVSSSNAQEALKVWAQIYLFETNRLAHMLYIPNYRDEVQARYRFERSGAEFIQALPGPADVAVGTRIIMNLTWM
jgi:plasmid maintenance system killer protein